jgi:hypothetical protein
VPQAPRRCCAVRVCVPAKPCCSTTVWRTRRRRR